MKTTIFTILFSIAAISGFAQDKTVKDLKGEASKSITKNPADTVPKTWKLGGLFNLNINQGALSNWSAGGDKFSFSLNS